MTPEPKTKKSLSPKQIFDSPLWSVRAIVLISIPVALVTLLLVVFVSSSSFVREMEITLAIIAAGLFLFLAVGLYRGVRLEKPVVEDPEKPFGSADFDAASVVGLATIAPPDIKLDVPDLGSSGDDLVGCLVSIVLWIVIAIVLMVLFWVLVQVLAFALPWVLLALYWLFYRALHLVFDKAPQTRGKILPSLGYALLFTVLYTGWLFLLLGALDIVRWLSSV